MLAPGIRRGSDRPMAQPEFDDVQERLGERCHAKSYISSVFRWAGSIHLLAVSSAIPKRIPKSPGRLCMRPYAERKTMPSWWRIPRFAKALPVTCSA
jgi:hypothetical protein